MEARNYLNYGERPWPGHPFSGDALGEALALTLDEREVQTGDTSRPNGVRRGRVSFRKLLLLQQTASLPSARSLDFKTAPI
jgi:hypothetical protein